MLTCLLHQYAQGYCRSTEGYDDQNCWFGQLEDISTWMPSHIFAHICERDVTESFKQERMPIHFLPTTQRTDLPLLAFEENMLQDSLESNFRIREVRLNEIEAICDIVTYRFVAPLAAVQHSNLVPQLTTTETSLPGHEISTQAQRAPEFLPSHIVLRREDLYP